MCTGSDGNKRKRAPGHKAGKHPKLAVTTRPGNRKSQQHSVLLAPLLSAGRHTPPGSSVTFVELSGNKGWIVESASERKVLEKSADGQFMVEHITGIDHLKTPIC